MKKIRDIAVSIRNNIRNNLSRILYGCSAGRLSTTSVLKQIKGCHSGRRAFIVCNGPSLKADDLTILHDNNEITFACNRIGEIFSYTDWRPTYYCVFDVNAQYNLIDMIKNTDADLKFLSIDSYVVTRNILQSVWLNSIGSRSLLNEPKFSSDLNEAIYTIGTVTYSMLQIAVYMGITELYIIGCDNSYSKEMNRDGQIIYNEGNSYFDGSNPKYQQNTVASIWEMNEAYKYASQYAIENGIKIYNATRGGHLEYFKRKEFDSLFNGL